jgi:hypothetical protein
MLNFNRRAAMRLAVIATACLAAASAQADLIISIGNASIVQGGTGFLDVRIRSDNGTDVLEGFFAEFAITPLVGSSTLVFSPTQTNGQLSQSDYVFFGNSSDPAPNNVGPPTTLIAQDAANTLPGTTIPSAAPGFLLARLDLSGVSAVAGDSFLVSLVNSINTDFFGPSPTIFSYTSSPGTVSITGAAVPEPSSFLLMVGGMGAVGWRYRRRKAAAAA